MAITRTMQQVILLVTMGAEPEKGGINQKNLNAMTALFENQSVGRVLVADYTTKAEFVIPKIADLLDPKKYEVDRIPAKLRRYRNFYSLSATTVVANSPAESKIPKDMNIGITLVRIVSLYGYQSFGLPAK